MTAETIAAMSGGEINTLALHLAKELTKNYTPELKYSREDIRWDFDAQNVIALFIHHCFWEIKEHGTIQTHPDYLVNRFTSHMRGYQYSAYEPPSIRWICRAFARQFVNDFSKLKNNNRYCMGYDHWVMLACEAYIEYNENWHQFYIESWFYPTAEGGRHPERKFCKAVLYERWTEYGDGGKGWEDMDEPIAAFDTKEQASFFLAQLVNLLNSSENAPVCQASAQLIRDTLAQAPQELERIQEELAEADRVAQAERERRQIEQNLRKLSERAKRDAEKNNRKCVYVFGRADGSSKIGISYDIKQRQTAIKNSGGYKVTQYCYTPLFPTSVARAIEAECHAHFANLRLEGEFFKVPYEEAKNYLRQYGELTESRSDSD